MGNGSGRLWSSWSCVLCPPDARAYCVHAGEGGGVLARSGEPLGAHERFVYVRACAPKLCSRCLGLWGSVRCVSEAGAHRVRWVHALPGVERSPGPMRTLAARARLHPLGRCELPSGVERVGEGNEPYPGARGPAPASPPSHLGPAPTCWAGGAGPGAWPGGARQSPGEGGRRLIPGIPRAPALASAAEPARRAPPVCACGCAERLGSVRERGREGACASARPRSAPGPARPVVPPLPPAGPGRPEAGEPRAARR